MWCKMRGAVQELVRSMVQGAGAVQELVRSVVGRSPRVLEVTGTPRLFESLESIQGELTLCEKALAEYLETKRLAFPRFYFISSADLLDILSNGNFPTEVSTPSLPAEVRPPSHFPT